MPLQIKGFFGSPWGINNFSNLIIQWGFNPATANDRSPYTMSLPTSFSNMDFIFMRVPNAMYRDATVQYLLGCTAIDVSQVQFFTSNTTYYSGDNWIAIGI